MRPLRQYPNRCVLCAAVALAVTGFRPSAVATGSPDVVPTRSSGSRTVVLEAVSGHATPPRQDSRSALSGKWVRNDERSDASFWLREYPGMTLEVRVAEDRIDVRQALGSVRDGVAGPGSGSEFLDYTLIADGQTRELIGPGSARRSVTAEWVGDSLRVRSVWHMSQNGESVDIPVTDAWAAVDAGARLQIRREARLPGREPKASTNVFDRAGS